MKPTGKGFGLLQGRDESKVKFVAVRPWNETRLSGR